MKVGKDVMLVGALAPSQEGVFSKADLQTALAERHPAAFVRRARSLQTLGALRRFTRGWYVAGSFDLPTLSQRLAPDSYVSFGTVLAKHLLIGAAPQRRVTAVKVGKARAYDAFGLEIEHVSITPHLFFGFDVAPNGVRYADPEKAVLDVLYFHLRGRRYVFDVYSDIAFDRLDPDRLREYLGRYRNPKFVAFACDLLELPR